jgi:stage II sporulation protein D
MRRRPLTPTLLAAAGCMLAAGTLWSCGREEPTPSQFRPLTYAGVPIVRVLITPEPLEQAAVATEGAFDLEVDGQAVCQGDGPLAESVVTRSGDAWRFGLLAGTGRQAVLTPAAGGCLRVGAASYRGRLQFLPVGPSKFIVVNCLDMESYLAGVLPRELYRFWLPATYRALAVAARTFATYQMRTFGASHDYDLGAGQASQVYGGFSAETEKAWQAVRSTHGQVLTWGAGGLEGVFLAQYSACCGGVVNGAGVIRDAQDIEPLRGGQTCTDCVACPRYIWPAVQISKADMLKAIAASFGPAGQLAGVKELRPVNQTSYGRVVWVDVVAPDGKSIRLRAEDIRLSLLRASPPGADKLYSMNCKFRDLGEAIEFYDGRGFGHGVGLCQWGAEAKAEQGAAAEEILNFYYPGARIDRAY